MINSIKLSLLIIAFASAFAPFAYAEETATTSPDSFATTTEEIVPPAIIETATTTTPTAATTTTETTLIPVEDSLPQSGSGRLSSTGEQNNPELPSTSSGQATIIERIVEVIREVPVYIQERAFDPATAPGKVSLSVRMPDGTPPTVSVYVSFVGVGGKTFGGQLDKEGNITVTMPQGRYYAEFLVIDTRVGPPADPPSFFLDANEEQTFGPLLLSQTSSFTDTALEAEVEKTLSEEKGGMAKILSLIVKLLLAILHEIRSLRSEMVSVVHPHLLFS